MGNERFEIFRSKLTQDNDRLIFKQSFCRKCVLMNMDMAELLFKFSDANYPDFSEYEIKMRREKKNQEK
jgi:hypothetical protein